MATPDAASVKNMFPHPNILATHAPGVKPNYESIQAAMTQLNANAAAIPSNEGDSRLGHLALTIRVPAYTLISAGNVLYIAPPPPAAAPLIPNNATAALISKLRQQFVDGRKAFQTYQAVDTALKQQLLAAADDRFVLSLRDRTHGFALLQTRQIVEHLYTSYGKILSADLTANDERMQTNWVVTTPIECLFAQIADGAAYATAGHSTYTDTQLVWFGYNLVDATNRMELACRDWRLKPDIDKTWINFEINFKAAHLDLRLDATTRTSGFNGRANHAASTNKTTSNDDTSNNDGTLEASNAITQAYLANLAEAQIANNAQVTSLAQTIAQLQVQLQAATTAVSNLQSNNRQQPHQPTKQPAHVKTKIKRYCWTHGGQVAATHNSQTCTSQAEGHKVLLATYMNRMGGSDRFCQNIT